ncbi:MAG: 3-methyl-2-oxobutanoate dehydrogenase subunit VorB [Candidatus Tectomicrobia bacterium]|uniref:3-methyl-2-oxobutanoate dehydrogenase subunit VorB n=1 Tax=Tectimicrobiota bacterium TaxID=2528274 RepID=A0A932CPS4_UNCTE|nr:3-methyl-2-oxobutanoate dehydrogenase subunit VorB [Candidatus Tectomicrobia bacterium]
MTHTKRLVKGNEAIAMAAILAGCRRYFAYPITPQNEIPEYMSEHMPAVGGTFLQAESELAAINMVYGAAAAGERAMTSTSGPGYSLMLEGFSGIATTEVPVVLALVMRGGPGIGSLETSQLDYFSAVKGGGHGGYRNLVLSASSVQELFDLTQLAFHLADRYRILVLLLVDGILGQIMEPLEIGPLPELPELPPKDWALTGMGTRGKQNVLSTMLMREGQVLEWHQRAQEKYRQIQEREIRFETQQWEDARIGIVAFGMMARVAETAIALCREEGIPVGLLRPITLFPFCSDFIRQSTAHIQRFLVTEVNLGQMVEDVRLAVEGRRPVEFVGRPTLPPPSMVVEAIRKTWRELKDGETGES